MTRRGLVRASGAGAAAAAFWACLPPAAAATRLEMAVAGLLAGRPETASDDVRLDLPAWFEQGTTVPLALAVASPMTPAEHVCRVSLFATGNPFPEVAAARFTPACGRAELATRIRLNAGRQEVVAVAELSDGRAWTARRTIEVTTSGCSGEAGVELDEVMPLPQPRLQLPAAVHRDELVPVRTMISHRMETGLRTDLTGRVIPRRIINRMVCLQDDAPIFTADLTPAIAPNAYLSFSLAARRSAVLGFVWREDGGAEYRASHPLTVI